MAIFGPVFNENTVAMVYYYIYIRFWRPELQRGLQAASELEASG